MSMRKLVTFLALILLFSILSGCATSTNTEKDNSKSSSETSVKTEPSTNESKGYNIFFTNAILTAPYCAVQLGAMQDYAKNNNCSLQAVDGKEDAQTQLDQIKNAVTQGVDGIIYFPGDQASTIPVVKYLASSGVPFVVLNSKVDNTVADLVPCYVGSNYEDMGRIAGEMALDTLGDKGGNIVIIDGLSGTEVAISTMKGFMGAIENNKDIKVLAKQPADWDTAKAMSIMEDFITTFGNKIDLVFAMDSGMTKGAAAALENAGLWGKIPVITSDQGQFVLDAIASGKMYGTAQQDPYQEGQLAMEMIIKLIKGEKVNKWEVVPTGKITKDNVSKFKGY